MKFKPMLSCALMLIMLALLLTACELPFDLPFLSGEATTTAAETTTEPTTTTTTASAITLPPVAASSNPIKDVKSTKSGLRLTHENGKTTMLEPELTPTAGRNGVTYAYSFDKASGVLSLTLFDAVQKNIALSHLGIELPASVTVMIRESNKNLEWAYEGRDDWAVLCKANDTKAAPLAAICEATGFAATDAETGTGVTFVISGNNLRFRARNWQNAGYDICTDAYLHSPSVDIFMQRALYEIPSTTPTDSMATGTKFKDASDEIPAINLNGTYIASYHGYYLISNVPNSAGLTEDDIGRVFTRTSDKQQYVLVKVPDGTAWFCPFDDEAMASGDFRSYGFPAKGLMKAGDILSYTNDSGRSKTITVSQDATQTQLRPAVNGVEQHAYLNGTVEVDLTKDGVYDADFVDFYETYNVLYLPAVLNFLMDNIGDNTNASTTDEGLTDYYLSYNQTHRFHNNGSYTAYQTITFHTTVSTVHYYGVMSGSFGGTEQYVYAPGSENCGTPTLHEKSTKSFYATGDYTIRSFYHVPDADYSKGMNVGYYPYFGTAKDEIREELMDRFGSVGEWYTSMKMYPHLFIANEVSAGDTISFIGYHVPTTRFDEDFFAIDWYFVGDEIYLSMHTENAVAERTVSIPNADYLVGLSISIEEASESFTVVSDSVTADGITVSTTGAGYVTLKLTASK